MNKIFGGILVGFLIWLPVTGQSDSTEAEYLERAQSYLERGELKAASIELRNALRQNQGNGEARRLLGKVYLEAGNALSAVKELRRASELGVADGEVLPLLARALLRVGKIEELQVLSLENLTTEEQKAVVLAAQGSGELLQQGEVAAAEGKINQAVSLAPQSAYAGVAKVLLLMASREDELARKELDRVFELDAEYAPAWALLGDLENRNKNLAKAEVAYSKAMENRANNLPDILKRAQVRIILKKYEAAQKDIDALKKRIPQNATVNYAQGLIYFQGNRLREAKDDFNLALSANDRLLQAMFYLSLTNLRLGNWDQAEYYANQFHAAAPGSIPGRKLLATIEFENQQYAKVVELIRPVVAAREDDVDAINLLAYALLKQNKVSDADDASNLLIKAASQQPDSADAQLRLGASLLAAGKQAKAIEHIKKALEMDPQLQKAHVLLVQSYLRQKDFGKALAAADVYRDHYPNSTLPYNMIGRIQLASGNETSAIKAFTRAREIAPGNPTASHGLAAMALKKKAYQEARNYYQDVLKYYKDHLPTLLKLAALDELEKKEQAMVERLQQAAVAHPKAIEPKAMLALYYLSQGKPGKVPALMFELSEKQKNHPVVLEVMARTRLVQKQYPEAERILKQLIVKQPDSAQAHFLLAQTYAWLGRPKLVREELERTIELAPGYFAARLTLVRLLLYEGEKEKAAEQMVKLNQLAPEHPDVVRLNVALARMQGDQETAAGLLEDVFEKSPSTASMLSVARQKWAMGSQAAALELQEEWMVGHPDDLVASMALASAYLQQDQAEQAINQYQLVLEKEDQNVIALNNLAWQLRDEQPAKALEYAERAAELAPKSTLVMDTFAVVLMKNGDIERAKRYIERVLLKKPKTPAFLYHSALIDVAAGDKASAIETLIALLGDGGDFFEKAEAQQLLAELQAGG